MTIIGTLALIALPIILVIHVLTDGDDHEGGTP